MKYLHIALLLSIVAGSSWIQGSDQEGEPFTFDSFKQQHANKSNEELIHMLYVKEKALRNTKAEQRAAVAADSAQAAQLSTDQRLERIQRALALKLGGKHPRAADHELKQAAHVAGSNPPSDAGPSVGGGSNAGSQAGSEASAQVDQPEERLNGIAEELDQDRNVVPPGYFKESLAARTETSRRLTRINGMSAPQMRTTLAQVVRGLAPDAPPPCKAVGFSRQLDVRTFDHQEDGELDFESADEQHTVGNTGSGSDEDDEVVFTPGGQRPTQPTDLSLLPHQETEGSDSDEQEEVENQIRIAASRERSQSLPTYHQKLPNPSTPNGSSTRPVKIMVVRKKTGLTTASPTPIPSPSGAAIQHQSRVTAGRALFEMLAAHSQGRPQGTPTAQPELDASDTLLAERLKAAAMRIHAQQTAFASVTQAPAPPLPATKYLRSQRANMMALHRAARGQQEQPAAPQPKQQSFDPDGKKQDVQDA